MIPNFYINIYKFTLLYKTTFYEEKINKYNNK